MRKEITVLNTGRNSVTDFKADVKSYTQPKVLDKYINGDGETMLKLDNGREMEETKFKNLWMPVKTKVKAKHYKGSGTFSKQKKL